MNNKTPVVIDKNELLKIQQRMSEARDILNELYTENLDYKTEYFPLIESNFDIDYLLFVVGLLTDISSDKIRIIKVKQIKE